MVGFKKVDLGFIISMSNNLKQLAI